MNFQREIAKLLILSRESEVQSLEFLFSVAELVRLLQKLVHDLQLERGASVLHLTAGGAKGYQEKISVYRASYIQDVNSLKQVLSLWLDQRYSLTNGVYMRLAGLLQQFEQIGVLREKIDQLSIQPVEAIYQFSDVINGVFNYVFEMAEQAPDAEIAKAMLTLFNFMQAKEAAGQERAIGVAILGSTGNAKSLCPWLEARVLQQATAFSIFKGFATEEQLKKLAHLKAQAYRKELEIWRQNFFFHKRADFDKAEAWFELMTIRIDGFQKLENELIDQLQVVSARRLQETQPVSKGSVALLEELFNDDKTLLSESVVKLQGVSKILLQRFQAQSQRMAEMESELVLAKQALLDRRFIEQAKSKLMFAKGLSEEQAHQFLQAQAMKSGRKLVEIAKTIL
ncbi:nitrate- and nitrite sensing domain-containing protein [Thiomicrospira microaerophila]|uniref:nitrate- and nitrite sensing domain-containing protein n=1 Tax=Thiomicrospira microaerophila TaxID=406020 RepID=UPI0005C976BF|nr:nitrate- and nitrite sensing domain-containing protein [Thiomicrospira microaerophila]